MSSLGKSYKKVHYEFRPAKQVERRMLVHAFHNLSEIGYPISEYEYTGLGSIYFIDFILFHRYLGLNRMTSVEGDYDIENRVEFNCPYGESIVEIVHDDITSQISKMSPDKRHILWLDFDNILTSEILDAVYLATAQLSTQSFLLITVDVEPPGKPEEGLTKWNPKHWMECFKNEAGDFFWKDINRSDFTRDHLPKTNARLLETVIKDGLKNRSESFIDMFSFLYADGHKMLSVGGMIGNEKDERNICHFRKKHDFLRTNIYDPYLIKVPLITRKERYYLDCHMPCNDDWHPKKFEMTKEDLEDYKRIYRYYPAYTEMLL